MNTVRLEVIVIVGGVICILAALFAIDRYNSGLEQTARICIAKSVSPNLAGCMVKR